MSIEELEKKIPELRKETGQTYNKLGISYKVAKRIHRGENYRFDAIFLYLDSLGYFLVLNGEVMQNIEQLGNALSVLRENQKVSWLKIQEETGISSQQIGAIEHGKNYYRSSLVKYLKYITVSFDVKSMLEYYNFV